MVLAGWEGGLETDRIIPCVKKGWVWMDELEGRGSWCCCEKLSMDEGRRSARVLKSLGGL